MRCTDLHLHHCISQRNYNEESRRARRDITLPLQYELPGNNAQHEVESYDNVVEDSFYEGCVPGMVVWMKSKDQAVASFEATELETFTPRDPPSFVLPWDSCADLVLPTTSCEDFPCQRLTPEDHIQNGQALTGMCMPNQGNAQHPDETEWTDFSC